MMQIEANQVTKVKITGVENYDSISVVLDDIAPRQGRIFIEHGGDSWSSYWGGMGSGSIAEFFSSCCNDYLIRNLSTRLRDTVDNCDNLDTWFKEEVIKMRKDKDISADKARDLWDDVETWCENSEEWLRSEHGQRMAHTILGEEWWYSIPQKENHEYTYLNGIVTAVKDGLKQLIAMKVA